MEYQSINAHRTIIQMVFILCMMLGITSCGRPDTLQPAAAPNQHVPPASTSTPTLSSLDATKQAIQDNELREIATLRAEPTPAILSTRAPDEPTIAPSLGIDIDCETMHARLYDYMNCWRGSVDGVIWFVVAGNLPEDPNQGIVGIYDSDSDDDIPNYAAYPTPTKAGWLEIVSVDLPRVFLTSRDGANFVFNLATLSYKGTTTPTSTPTP